MRRKHPSYRWVPGFLVLALLVAACGDGGAEPSASTDGATGTTEESVDTTAASGGEKEPVTLKVWATKSYGEDAPMALVFEQLIAEFEEQNPHIDVELESFPEDGFDAKVRTAAAAQTGPDVFQTSNWGDEFHDVIVPVSGLVTEEQRERVLAVDERVSGRYDETLVMPYGLNANLILYNRELFEQAGLDPDNPPRALEDFLNACDSLNAAGITPISIGLQDGWWIAYFHLILGAQTLNDELQAANQADEMPLDIEEYRIPLEATIEIYERGCFGEDALSKASGDTYPDFEAGLTAMRPDGRIPAATLEALGQDNVDFMLYPRLPESLYDHDVTSAGANSAWAVTNWAPVDEAWAFISYLTDVHGQEVLWTETNLAPNNTEVDVAAIANNPVEEKYLNLMLNTPGIVRYGAFPGTYAGAFENYNALAPSVLAGDMSVEDFLAAIEAYRQENLEGS